MGKPRKRELKPLRCGAPSATLFPQWPARDIPAPQARRRHLASRDAGPARAAGDAEGAAGPAHLRLLCPRQSRLVFLRDLQADADVAVGHSVAAGQGLGAGAGKKDVDATRRDGALLALVTPQRGLQGCLRDFRDSVRRKVKLQAGMWNLRFTGQRRSALPSQIAGSAQFHGLSCSWGEEEQGNPWNCQDSEIAAVVPRGDVC